MCLVMPGSYLCNICTEILTAQSTVDSMLKRLEQQLNLYMPRVRNVTRLYQALIKMLRSHIITVVDAAGGLPLILLIALYGLADDLYPGQGVIPIGLPICWIATGLHNQPRHVDKTRNGDHVTITKTKPDSLVIELLSLEEVADSESSEFCPTSTLLCFSPLLLRRQTQHTSSITVTSSATVISGISM